MTAILTNCPADDLAGVRTWTVYAEKTTVGREKTEWRSYLLHSDKHTNIDVMFTDEKIFTVTTPKNPQNDRLYSYSATRKKDNVTKRLSTQLTLFTVVLLFTGRQKV